MARWFGLVILFCGVAVSASGQVFWLENFTGLTNGATSDGGATAWTTVQPSGGTFAKATVVGQDVFLIDNTVTEGIWQSAVINIAAQGEVAVEVTLGANFSSSSDYVRAFYRLDGGPEIQFGEATGTPALVVSTAASTIVTGTTVQIIIRGKDNTPGSTSGIQNAVGFDDVSLTKISLLYSRATGNWDDNTVWSTTGFAGASCSCVPDDNSRVIIGNNRTISLDVAGFTSGINVKNTGTLQWSANNLAMNIRHGGTVNIETGGVMTNNSKTGSSIVYNAYAYDLIVDGAFTIGTITLNTGANLTASGAGTLTAATVTAGMGNGKQITNNISGAFNVSTSFNFPATTSAGVIFNNNGNLNAAQLFFDDVNVALNNTGTIVIAGNIAVNNNSDDNNKITNTGTLSYAALNLGAANFFINNSGSVTQSGNFLNIDPACSFKNLAAGSWAWSLSPNTGFDNDILTVLDLTAATNTFNYNGAGAQNIMPVIYSNLSLSNSGTRTRTAGGLITVGGNLLIQNSAVLDISTPSGTDISLAGNWTVLNTATFNPGTRTVTFNGSGTQTITNASGQTFYNLILNTNAATNTVALANNITVSNVLTLTNGGLSLNGNSSTLTGSTTAALSVTSGYVISETTTAPYGRFIWNTRTTIATFTIPFRDATNTAIPFVFNKTTAGTEAGTGSISVATYHTASNNTPYPATVTNVDRSGTDNSGNVADRFWIITPSGYSVVPASTVTFSVTAVEAAGITANTLRAQHWVAPLWEQPIAGQTNPSASTQAQVSIPGTSLASIWTLSGNNKPLPIELIAFNAEVSGDVVVTTWKTAQELHNDFFTVEKSHTGESFSEVGTVDGAGDSHHELSYSLNDESPFNGRSYYRLKQTDLDGHFTYSAIVPVDYDGASNFFVRTYPNPSKGQRINIEIKGVKENTSVPVVIYNLQGVRLYDFVLTQTEAGAIETEVEFTTALPSGLYILRAGNLQQGISKLVVE